MPLLTVTTSATPDGAARTDIAEVLAESYADTMDTTTGHVAVVFNRVSVSDMWLGREVDGDLCFLEADIRRGRDHDRRREFALRAMDCFCDRLGVPKPNLKVAFTEHEGAELMGYARVGSEWSPDESSGEGGK